MALETLKDVNQIGKEKISHIDDVAIGFYENEHIWVNHKTNTVAFKIQNGPIKEVGVNGCQVTDMIRVAKHIIVNLNEKYPSHENTKTIDALAEALEWQDKRTRDREARGVEGFSQK